MSISPHSSFSLGFYVTFILKRTSLVQFVAANVNFSTTETLKELAHNRMFVLCLHGLIHTQTALTNPPLNQHHQPASTAANVTALPTLNAHNIKQSIRHVSTLDRLQISSTAILKVQHSTNTMSSPNQHSTMTSTTFTASNSTHPCTLTPYSSFQLITQFITHTQKKTYRPYKLSMTQTHHYLTSRS